MPDPCLRNFFPWPPARLPKVRKCFSLHLREVLKFQQMRGREHTENHNISLTCFKICIFYSGNCSQIIMQATGPRLFSDPGRKILREHWTARPENTPASKASHAQKKTCGFGFGVWWDADGLRVLEASSQSERTDWLDGPGSVTWPL